MKSTRYSALVTLALAVTACLLLAGATTVHPGKICYDASHEVIPCKSNYLQTAEAKKANPPTVPPVPPTQTPSPTASPTATQTTTATSSETPVASATAAVVLVPSAAEAPAPARLPARSPDLAGIPLWAVGGAVLLAIVIAVVLLAIGVVMWLRRRNSPPSQR